MTCVKWSKEHGTIVAGTEEGMVKLLKLENSRTPSSGGRRESGNVPSKSQLSLNQSLDGHKGAITKVSWNEKYSKLITADETGLIIVWVLYRGSWFEEMVTRSDKDKGSGEGVTGLKWSPDGELIAMLFSTTNDSASGGHKSRGAASGSIIVGTVDGKRNWEKDLKANCEMIEWSPDGKLILIGILDIEVHIFDVRGDFMNKITVQNVAFDSINIPSDSGPSKMSKNTYSSKVSSGEMSRIIAIEWSRLFNSKPGVPTLAIAFESGRIQIMRNEYDDDPTVIHSELSITNIAWNYSGNVLGVCGYIDSVHSKSSDLLVKFFDLESETFAGKDSFLVNTLRVPGKSIRGIDWDADNLKLCLAVDSFVMFANIRPDYKWAWFDNTCVFWRSLPDAKASDANKSVLVFFPVKSGHFDAKDGQSSRQLVTKSVNNLIDIQASGHCCIYAYRMDQKSDAKRAAKDDANLVCSLTICNIFGTPVDSLQIEFMIRSLALNSKYVFAAGKDEFLVWKFTAHDLFTERDSDLDNLISDAASSFSGEKRRSSLFGTDLSTRTVSVPNGDIVAITASESILVVALRSKMINVYTVPKVTLIKNFEVDSFPLKMSINSDSSKLALLDSASIVTFYDLDTEHAQKKFEKKDVWNLKWASDDPDSFALSEKNKLIIYREFEPEESGQANGYLASFSDLEIRTIDLDHLLASADLASLDLASVDLVSVIETKPLKDARDMIEKEGVVKCMEMFERSPNEVFNHAKIWRLLANEALNQLNLSVAEHCFVRLKEFKSIQFIRRMSNLSKDELKRAEICCYFGNFDAAEKIYMDIDRTDLAIHMRAMMGHPLHVIALIKAGNQTIPDADMRKINSDAGDYLYDNFNYSEAIKYYKKAGNLERTFETLLRLENFDAMSDLLISQNLEKEFSISDKSTLSEPFKVKLARAFESVGMVKEAVKVYLALGQADDAVMACVRLNDWKSAISLAHAHHDVTDIDSLLNKYASHLIQKKKYFEIIELYKKASRVHDACAVILKLIDDAKNLDVQDGRSVDATDYLLMKKLHTLIGVLSFEEKTLTLSERREQLQTARSSRSAQKQTAMSEMTGPPSTAASSRSDRRGNMTPGYGRKKSLATLLADDAKDGVKVDNVDSQANVSVHRTLDNPWRGAEAYHLLLLTQRLLTENSDRARDLSLKSALRLPDYEDYLLIEDIYSLLALASLISKRYDIASRAFIKLESCPDMNADKKKLYKELALEIFSKHSPKSARTSSDASFVDCSYCETKIADTSTTCPSCATKFPFCTASAQSIFDPAKAKACQRCNHFILVNYDHVFNYNHCPLCHYCM